MFNNDLRLVDLKTRFDLGSSQNAGPEPGSGSGCHFFSYFFCFSFCRYSPVLLFSNVRHLSFIYGGN